LLVGARLPVGFGVADRVTPARIVVPLCVLVGGAVAVDVEVADMV
jgi:hypothetical protein